MRKSKRPSPDPALRIVRRAFPRTRIDRVRVAVIRPPLQLWTAGAGLRWAAVNVATGHVVRVPAGTLLDATPPVRPGVAYVSLWERTAIVWLPPGGYRALPPTSSRSIPERAVLWTLAHYQPGYRLQAAELLFHVSPEDYRRATWALLRDGWLDDQGRLAAPATAYLAGCWDDRALAAV